MATVEAKAGPLLRDRMRNERDRVRYKRMVDCEDREAVFRLRHDAYLREGAIARRDDGLFSDEIDEAGNTFLFGVFVDDDLAGSIRLTVTLPGLRDLPTAAVFPDRVGPELAMGRILVDPTRFVADPVLSRRLPELPYFTLRLPWMAMEHFDADLMLIAVRPEHLPFYRRLWGAAVACAARPYPKLAKPVGLAVLDYRDARARVLARNPYFASTSWERQDLFETVTLPPAHELGRPGEERVPGR